MIIQLYRKGISTREIADIIEKMYGSVNNTPKKHILDYINYG